MTDAERVADIRLLLFDVDGVLTDGVVVYYFSSAMSLGSPDRPVSFTVPTGNFGDMFAGYAAKRMGLPIERLVIATNDNDILARTLRERRLRDARGRRHDLAVDGHPAVVEFRAAAVRGAPGRDAATVRRYMDGLKQSGAFAIEAGATGQDARRLLGRPRRRWPRSPRPSAGSLRRAATCSIRIPRRRIHVADATA